MKEIPEPALTQVIQEMDSMGVYPLAFIEFIGGIAYWLEGNVPGSRIPPEKQLKLWENKPWQRNP